MSLSKFTHYMELLQQADGGTYNLWTMRKHYIGRLVGLGLNVFQSDLDVIWTHNPYPYLKTIWKDYHLVLQEEGSECPRANGGVIYVQNALPGGPVQVRSPNPFFWRATSSIAETKAAARLVLEVSAAWASPSTRSLWRGGCWKPKSSPHESLALRTAVAA